MEFRPLTDFVSGILIERFCDARLDAPVVGGSRRLWKC